MRHDKLERELDLLLLLTENRHYDVETLCQRLAISRRMFYYYLESFRDWGFIVEKSGRCYSIDRESPYLKRLFETINFTEEEALTLLSILNKVGEENALAQRIRYKLNRFYDFHILDNPALRERVAHCVSVLYDAIKRKRVVKLVGYASPHSDTVSDRVVEPFLLLNDNNDVRCYELSSGQNKTFKLSRMRDVIMLDLSWSCESKHKWVFTDIFMFSGEERLPVAVRLDRLAYQVFVEEYPRAAHAVTQEDAAHYVLRTEVVSYRGIGRFVLGLYDHVEVLGDEGFQAYVRETLRRNYQRSLLPPAVD